MNHKTKEIRGSFNILLVILHGSLNIHSFEFFSLDKFYFGSKRNKMGRKLFGHKLCPLSTTGSKPIVRVSWYTIQQKNVKNLAEDFFFIGSCSRQACVGTNSKYTEDIFGKCI